MDRFAGWYRRALLMKFTDISKSRQGNRKYVQYLYSVWSKFYDVSMVFDPAYRRNARIMVEKVVQPGDRVLDVGTGTAMLAEYAAPRAREYFGIDYSGSMLSKAAKKIANKKLGNVMLRWGDVRSLPYEDDYFDVVISSFMMAHLNPVERGAVLQEISRVLKANGRLGLYQCQGEIYPLFSTRAELEHNLTAAGFEHIKIEDCDHIYRITVAQLS
ncbi:class I SAM-dependent methyltransferase [candidate division CSSED10-310 bacterium]|uniref:Class I SAM-dependent methyltransferase n=1 Tax=candidate division CSSED10-310 bacterium TaxID=2855610 RepID=A0ABV6Z122_UNCC1